MNLKKEFEVTRTKMVGNSNEWLKQIFHDGSPKVRYPYVGETTAVEAISQAGGLTDFAKKRKISVIRGNGSQITFDYEKARRDSQLDPPIYPKDIIDVPRRLYW